MIKNIVFDFGGVLVQYDFLLFFSAQLGSKKKAEWFLNNVFTGKINADMDRGVHEPEYFFNMQKKLWPEYAYILDNFDKNYTDIFTHESEGLRALMLDMKARGYKLLGLSNWSSKVYEVMDKFDIFQLLEGYLLSKDVHQLKPEPEIYQSFFQKFGVKAEESVFIDDKPENIVAAQNVGMYGIVYYNSEQLTHELDPLLLPYTFEPATTDDELAAWSIINDSAKDMVSRGRHQWDDGYPPRQSVADDIAKGNGYVIRLDGKVVAYTAVTFDGEPAYDQLKGEWLSSGKYGTIHRTAVSLQQRGRGLGRLLFIEAERLCHKRNIHNLRMDTNYDNTEILNLVESLAFKRCGICHYVRGDEIVERIAFEKTLKISCSTQGTVHSGII